MTVWIPTPLIWLLALFGGYFTFRALSNLNAITRSTRCSMLVVNLLLGLGGFAAALSPIYGMALAGVGQLLICIALVLMMRYGRREPDRMTPRNDSAS